MTSQISITHIGTWRRTSIAAHSLGHERVVICISSDNQIAFASCTKEAEKHAQLRTLKWHNDNHWITCFTIKIHFQPRRRLRQLVATTRRNVNKNDLQALVNDVFVCRAKPDDYFEALWLTNPLIIKRFEPKVQWSTSHSNTYLSHPSARECFRVA